MVVVLAIAVDTVKMMILIIVIVPEHKSVAAV